MGVGGEFAHSHNFKRSLMNDNSIDYVYIIPTGFGDSALHGRSDVVL